MGNEYLLFTEKYSGSIAENAYVVKGLHHGIYRLDDEVFKDLSDLNSTLKDEIESYSFTELKNLILSLE